jgi:hypothetical protein
MATGGVITTTGKNVMLNRTYKAVPDYTIPSVFSVGLGLTTPVAADTAIEIRVPITDGTTNDDGSNTGNLVGSAGGTTSTDNITTFKQGGGNSDATAQNLLANGSSVSKTWTIANLAAAGAVMTLTEPFGVWIYMDETACYDLLAAAGTVFDIRFRTNGDGATLYYQYVRTKAQLAAGWNWVTSGTTIMTGLTVGGGGAPSGVLDEVVLIITTAAAGTTFTAGECVWDLLRGWAASDLINTFASGYPTFDEVNQKVTTRTVLTSIQANGFNLSEFGLFNTDGTPKIISHDVYTAESKSDTDEFIFIVEDELV